MTHNLVASMSPKILEKIFNIRGFGRLKFIPQTKDEYMPFQLEYNN